MIAYVGLHDRYRVKRAQHLRTALGEPCPYCGVTMNRDNGYHSPQAPSRDHRVPVWRGGSERRANIIIVCRGCNEEKGCLTSEEYMAVRAGLACRLDIRFDGRQSMNDIRSIEMRKAYNKPKKEGKRGKTEAPEQRLAGRELQDC